MELANRRQTDIERYERVGRWRVKTSHLIMIDFHSNEKLYGLDRNHRTISMTK
jgi:hypothetical protein